MESLMIVAGRPVVRIRPARLSLIRAVSFEKEAFHSLMTSALSYILVTLVIKHVKRDR